MTPLSAVIEHLMLARALWRKLCAFLNCHGREGKKKNRPKRGVRHRIK
jgi:hypothetical protein